jgi:hypothetical protein
MSTISTIDFRRIAVAAVVAASCTVSLAADGAAALRRDPFMRPAPPSSSAGGAAAEWKPELRAILFDRERPLVNIDGRILGVGESVHGYVLLTVEERAAVLGGNGRQMRLELDRTPSP